jgi:hypothetical protein
LLCCCCCVLTAQGGVCLREREGNPGGVCVCVCVGGVRTFAFFASSMLTLARKSSARSVSSRLCSCNSTNAAISLASLPPPPGATAMPVPSAVLMAPLPWSSPGGPVLPPLGRLLRPWLRKRSQTALAVSVSLLSGRSCACCNVMPLNGSSLGAPLAADGTCVQRRSRVACAEGRQATSARQ